MPAKLLHSRHAGLPAEAKSASWSHHSTETSAAKSAKHVHKSYAAAPTHAADKLSIYHPAAVSAAWPEASGSAAAARKGKARLTDSSDELQRGASLRVGTSAGQHKQGDGQTAAMLLSHPRLRSKVCPILPILAMSKAHQLELPTLPF